MSSKDIFGDYFLKYNGYTIMKEGNSDKFMILKSKTHWYEKIIPNFLIPDPVVLQRGIISMNEAQKIIDQG